MKLELKDIPAKLAPLLAGFRRYLVVFFLVVFAGMSGFLIFRINELSHAEPTEEAITEKMNPKELKIDQSLVNKLDSLHSTIRSQTGSGNARSPFTE
jgi:hypothetical protein